MFKNVAKILAVVAPIVLAIYFVEDRYALSKDLNSVSDALEQNTISTFKDLKKINQLQILQLKYEIYTSEIQQLYNQLKLSNNNPEIAVQLTEAKHKQTEAWQQMQHLLTQ